MNRTYIGIDGGGTWTRAVAIDETGTVLGQSRAGSTNRNHHTEAELVANLRETLIGACPQGLDQVDQIVMGMAGVSTDADREELVRLARLIPELRSNTSIQVENDTLTGLVGGLAGKPGVVLIAGTGSAAFGRNIRGQTALCGGWGAIADDEGSAYALSVAAIYAAVRAEDGRGPQTMLREAVFAFLGIADQPRSLIDRLHNSDLGRGDLAQLAPAVIDAYRAGDAVARVIVRPAVVALGELVATTARSLFTPDEPFGLVLVGGLALSGDPFQTELEAELQSCCPAIEITSPILPLEFGAALEALRLGGQSVTAKIIDNLRQGLPA